MTQWILNPYWEILFLGSGDVLLNHVHANSFRLRNPTSGQLNFLRKLDRAHHDNGIELHARSATADNVRDVQALISRLNDEDVLRDIASESQVGDLSSSELARFGSFLAWLGRFENRGYGVNAFKKLRASQITIIGMGGAGSTAAMMLAACGIGHLVLVDGDRVNDSNLVRQIFYSEEDVARKELKVDALRKRIEGLSSFTSVSTYPIFVCSSKDVTSFIANSDLVLLTGDQPRVLINRFVNEACVNLRIPLLYSFVEQLGPLFVPGISSCFACLERHWRNEIGSEHDEIVDALQVRKTIEYPSMVSGPIQIADAMVIESIGHITNLYEPQTLNGIVYVGQHHRKKQVLSRFLDCPLCGSVSRTVRNDSEKH